MIGSEARLLHRVMTRLALLGPREMSDLSPQSGPRRTLGQVAVNRDFMSTRPRHPALCTCAQADAQPATAIADRIQATSTRVVRAINHGGRPEELAASETG